MPEAYLSPFGAVTVDERGSRPSTRAEMDAARHGQITAHIVKPRDRADVRREPPAAATASAPSPTLTRERTPMTNRLQTDLAGAAARREAVPTAAVRKRGKALMEAEVERQGITKNRPATATTSGTPASGKALMVDLVRSRGGTPCT